jgi:hypothetical protein
MITKIKARYESHPDSEIELDSGLTVLLGTNDHGKSGFNRALTWVATNTPRGESMIPWTGLKQAWVEIEADGNTVKRQKGPGNTYTVNDVVLKAIGNSVPDEVLNALNIDSLNLQKQVDQYFILQQSPGDVAKQINAMAGIEESDMAIKRTNERIRETDKEIKALKSDINSYNTFLGTHQKPVAEAGAILEQMLQDEHFIGTTRDLLTKANVLSRDIRNSESNLSRFPDYGKAEGQIEEIQAMGQDVEQRAAFCHDAGVLCHALRDVDLERFDVLDQSSTEDMEELDSEIGKSLSRLAAMRDMAVSLNSVDLDRFDVLDAETETAVSWMGLLTASIDTDLRKLSQAKNLLSEFKSVNTGRFDILEQASTDELDLLTEQINKLHNKRDMLIELEATEIEIDKLNDYLEICKEQLSTIEELCPTCGQIVRGSDVANHIHS